MGWNYSVMSADSSFGAQAVDHLAHLRRSAAALTRNRADAEDLVQEAYVRALRASRRFQPGTNLRAWLSTILRNLTLNHRRDAHRWRAVFEPADPALDSHAGIAPASTAPDQELMAGVIGPELQAALAALPQSLRDAVWLRDVEDMSYAAIAAHQGIPIGTVMSRIARGRRQLYARLTVQKGTSENGRGAADGEVR
jgi:RNA polymerase sigma-70 factor (ECF subfamily)